MRSRSRACELGEGFAAGVGEVSEKKGVSAYPYEYVVSGVLEIAFVRREASGEREISAA